MLADPSMKRRSTGAVGIGTAPREALERAARRLADRLTMLEADDRAWSEYVATAAALAQVVAQVTPGRSGEMLSTAEMASRLGITPKTLLKHKASRKIRPAVEVGKLIRWRGDEWLS